MSCTKDQYSFSLQKNLLLLKSKIKGLAVEVKRGRVAHKEMKPLTTQWYNTMMLTKSIGEESRLYLLAYGFLRGMPYHSMESRTAVKPKADLILKVIHDHIPSWDKDKWTIDMIETFLDVESEDPTPDSFSVTKKEHAKRLRLAAESLTRRCTNEPSTVVQVQLEDFSKKLSSLARNYERDAHMT